MPKEDTKDLKKFLAPFPESVQEIALWLRAFVWDLYPDCNELIYDNYNALAIGFAPTDKAGDVFCSIAIYSKHVNFGFNRGSEIADPDAILNGKGSLYRHITIKQEKDFLKGYMEKLIHEAYVNAMTRLKPKIKILKGRTITKSISPVQKRPKKE
jgi:hypothetical protein